MLGKTCIKNSAKEGHGISAKGFFFFGLGFMHEEKTKKLGAKDQVPCVMVIFEVKTTTKKQMSSAFYILHLVYALRKTWKKPSTMICKFGR